MPACPDVLPDGRPPSVRQHPRTRRGVAARLAAVSLAAAALVLGLPAVGPPFDTELASGLVTEGDGLPAAPVAARPLRTGEVGGERASRSRRVAVQPPEAAPVAPVAPPAAPVPPPPAFSRPVDGAVTSWFGRRWGRLHAGVDVGVPVGTPVRAIAGATVLSVSRERGGYGTSVQLALPGGVVAVYAHLSEVLVVAGPVAAGDVIALSGNTGRSTGPHLHLELRGPQGPFDPAPWLAERGITL